MNEQLSVRSFSWLSGNLSWAFALGELLKTFEKDHNVLYVSTNGVSGNPFVKSEDLIKSAILLQEFGPGKKQIDIDITYTIPPNLTHRFLNNSKNKCVVYNYEYAHWPKEWKQFYGLATHWFPSSNFSAEIFVKNGIPKEKVFVIPHGVDTHTFNSNIKPIKLKTEKKFKFVSVTAPHSRKNIDILLDAYCKTFTKNDDVCLILKTKIYKHSDGIFDEQKNINGRKAFEICIGDVFQELVKKYGKNMPEIELSTGHLDNVSSLYNACQAHITAAGCEGFGMPLLESMACGLISIAPNYSGQTDFMNTSNSILYDVAMRKAKIEDQYWHSDKRNLISIPKIESLQSAMVQVYKNYDSLKNEFAPTMSKVVEDYSWKNAKEKIIKSVNGELPHYMPGTYKL